MSGSKVYLSVYNKPFPAGFFYNPLVAAAWSGLFGWNKVFFGYLFK
jgi:hypothetical protein